MTATPEQIQALIDAAQGMADATAEFSDADEAKDESAEQVSAAMTIDDANQMVYDAKKAALVEAGDALDAALEPIIAGPSG